MSSERRAAPRKRKNISTVLANVDKTNNKVAPFLSKLSTLVTSMPTEVGGWTDDGLSFLVNDELASRTVLPQYFSHTNFRSFCRQLSCYGFRKTRRRKLSQANGQSGWSEFQHALFQRDRPELLCQIRRMEHLSPSDGSRAAGSDRPRSRAPPKRQRSNSDMSEEDAAAALRGVFTRTPRPSGSGIDGLAVLTAALSAQAPAAAPQQTPAPVTVDAPETPAVDRRLTTGASAWPAAAPFSTPRDAEPVARTVSTTEGDAAAAPDVKLLQNRVATLEQMLVERDAFISQLFAKTHPGADGAAPSVTPRQPPPTVDVEAPPLAKVEEADGDASPKNVASVPASDERAPTVAFAAPLCVEPPPASVAV